MVCKVVSIEDEPEIAELLRIVLSSPEIEVYSCDNGPDGVQLVQTCKPDLVILDIMLPGMNGWGVYDAIRSDEAVKATPIVMLSVLREAPERRQAFVGSPIDLYVTKPFDTIRLRGDIERMLGRKGLWPVTKPLIRAEESNPADPPTDKPPVEVKAASGNGLHSVNLELEDSASSPAPVPSPEQAVSTTAEPPASTEEKQDAKGQESSPVANSQKKPAVRVSKKNTPAQAKPADQATSSQPKKPAKRTRSKKKADPVLTLKPDPAPESNKPV